MVRRMKKKKTVVLGMMRKVEGIWNGEARGNGKKQAELQRWRLIQRPLSFQQTSNRQDKQAAFLSGKQ